MSDRQELVEERKKLSSLMKEGTQEKLEKTRMMCEVAEFLKRCNCTEYAERFEREGYDRMDLVKMMELEDLKEMYIKPGHRKLLLREIQSLRDHDYDWIPTRSPREFRRSRSPSLELDDSDDDRPYRRKRSKIEAKRLPRNDSLTESHPITIPPSEGLTFVSPREQAKKMAETVEALIGAFLPSHLTAIVLQYAAQTYKVGDFVRARWSMGDSHYSCRVREVHTDENTYTLEYLDDARIEKRPASDLRSHMYCAGDPVVAVYGETSLDAVVQHRNPEGSYAVLYSNGFLSRSVPEDAILKFRYNVGDNVWAKQTDNSITLISEITQVNADQTYGIKYCDGHTKENCPARLIVMPCHLHSHIPGDYVKLQADFKTVRRACEEMELWEPQIKDLLGESGVVISSIGPASQTTTVLFQKEAWSYPVGVLTRAGMQVDGSQIERGDRVRVKHDVALVKRETEASDAGWNQKMTNTIGREGVVARVSGRTGTVRVCFGPVVVLPSLVVDLSLDLQEVEQQRGRALEQFFLSTLLRSLEGATAEEGDRSS